MDGESRISNPNSQKRIKQTMGGETSKLVSRKFPETHQPSTMTGETLKGVSERARMHENCPPCLEKGGNAQPQNGDKAPNCPPWMEKTANPAS